MMRCPKCNKLIAHVMVVSEIYQKGYLNPYGEISEYGTFEGGASKTIRTECPLCFRKIKAKEANG